MGVSGVLCLVLSAILITATLITPAIPEDWAVSWAVIMLAGSAIEEVLIVLSWLLLAIQSRDAYILDPTANVLYWEFGCFAREWNQISIPRN